MGSKVAGFGFSTIQGRDLAGLGEDLSHIAAVGAGFAELSLCSMDLVAAGRPLVARVRELERITAGHNLRYSAHGPLAANFMDARHEALFRRAVEGYIEVCGAVGATVLVLHTGIVSREPRAALDQAHARERSVLRHLGDVAARHEVRLAVETLFAFAPDRYTASPSRLAAEIAAVDHPNVTGCLDISHARLQCAQLGLDFETEVAAFAAVTGHVHIHDSFGLPETVRGFTQSESLAFGQGDVHLPLGLGDIPFERLLSRLAVRDGTAIICEMPPHFRGDRGLCAERLAVWLPLIGTAAT